MRIENDLDYENALLKRQRDVTKFRYTFASRQFSRLIYTSTDSEAIMFVDPTTSARLICFSISVAISRVDSLETE